MGRASISIAITSSYNAKGVKQAQESVRKLTSNLVALRGGVGASDIIQGSKLAEASGHLDNLGKSMQRVGDSFTKCVTVPTGAAVGATVAATAQIDTAWYNVRKTVEATEGEYQRLRDNAVELSKTSPVSAETILNIEGLGGQLGIANNNLEDFAKTASGLDIATNMSADSAATSLARFMNITGLAQDKAGNLGSTVVDLGNHFATSESEIMDMATRIASAGSQAGMTEADILGLSTALSSTGMAAEAGGSAVSTVIRRIETSCDNYEKALDGTMHGTKRQMDQTIWMMEGLADVTGMTVDEFRQAWAEDATGTLTDFLVKAGEMGDAGESLNTLFSDLGISEIRTSDAMRRLAGNSGLVKKAVDQANTAFEENTALAREVDERNNSVEARFGTLKNQVIAAADSFGGPLAQAILDFAENTITPLLQNIENVGKAFDDMPKSQQQMIVGFGAAAAAAGPLLSVGGRLVQGMGKIVNWAGRVKQSQGILKSAMSETSDGMLQQLAASDDASAKLGLLQNSYVRAAGGIDSYVEKSRIFTDAFKTQAREAAEAKIANDDFASSFAGMGEEVDAAVSSLADARERAKTSMDSEADAIARVNEADLRASEANAKLKEAYKQLTDAQKLRIQATKDEQNAEEAIAQRVGDAVAKRAEAIEKVREAQQKLSEASSRVQEAQARFVTSSEQAITASNRQKEAQAQYNSVVEKYGENSQEAQAALQNLASANRDLKTVNRDVNDSFKDLRKAQDDVKSASSELEQAGVRVKETQQQVADAMNNTGDSVLKLSDAEKQEEAAMRNLNEANKNAAQATIDKRKAHEDLNNIYKNGKDAAQQVADAEQNLADKVVNSTRTTKECDKALKNYVGSGKMAKDSLKEVGESARNMGDVTSTAFNQTQSAGAKMSGAIAGTMSALGGKIKAIGSTIKATMSTMLPVLAISAVVGIIGSIVGKMQEAKERTQKLADSGKRLEETSVYISGYGDNWKKAGDKAKSAGNQFQSAGDTIKNATDKIIESNNALADSIDQIKLDYKADTFDLETAGQRILELASSSEWSASKQEQLKKAVEDYNSVAGTQWEVVDGTNGVIRDNAAVTEECTGIIYDIADAIDKSIEARKRELEYMAYEDMYKEAYKNREQAVMELAAAEEAYAKDSSQANKERLDEARQAAEDSEGMLKRTESAFEGIKNAQDAAGKSLGEWVANHQEYAEAFAKAGDRADAFRQALEATGASTETIVAMGADNLGIMASAFDGSFDSIISSLGDLGANLEEFGITTDTLITNSEAFNQAFQSNFNSAFSDSGAAMSAFSAAINACGYSTSDLATLSSEDLQKVVAAWDGNTASLINILNDFGVQMPLLGSIASKSWAQNIDDGAQSAVAAVANAKGLTIDQLDDMASQLGEKGNAGMIAFAAALADGSVQAGMSAEEVASVVQSKMDEMDLGTPIGTKVDEAVTNLYNSNPAFKAAMDQALGGAEQSAAELDFARYTGAAADQGAKDVAAKRAEYQQAQAQNNAAAEGEAANMDVATPAAEASQEGADAVSNPEAYSSAGAENAQSTAEGYRSVDITGPVNEAVRSALADALSGNTDGARETGRALGEGIVEGIANADVSSAGQTMGNNLTSAIGAIDVTSAGTSMGQRLTDALSQTDLTAAGQQIANTLAGGISAYDFGALGLQAGTSIAASFNTSMLLMAFSSLAQGAMVAAQFTTGFNTAIASFDASAAGWALANSVSAGVTSADYFTPGSYAGQATVAGFSAAATSAFAPGLALGSTFTAGVSAGAAAAPVIASGLSSAAGASFGAGASGARAGGSALGLGFVTALRGTAGQITAAARTLSANAATGLRSGTSAANSSGKSVGRAFASGIQSMYSSVANAARSLSYAISAISTNNWRARGWGQEAGQNFANGLWDKVGAVQRAAQALAAAAAGPLHHSTPDYGPLVDDDKWGGEMVQNIVASMNKATPSLARAASKVSATMAEANNPYDRWVPYGGDEARAQVGKTGDVYNITIDGRMVEADPALKNAVNGLVSQVARRANMGR